jgi:hypothetical protein
MRPCVCEIPHDPGNDFLSQILANPPWETRVRQGMDTSLIERKFEELGARAKFLEPRRVPIWASRPPQMSIDIQKDRRGEFFEIRADEDADVSVLDVRPRDRHLLLMVRQPAENIRSPEIKDKFLCGHDERHWFVAGVPEAAAVSTVITAKEALKPEIVRRLEHGQRGKRSKRHRRKTEHFIRQGEWFFIPVGRRMPEPRFILRNEPLRRGGGKPHICAELCRAGGTTVYVNDRHRNGLTIPQYQRLVKEKPEAAHWHWQVLQRDPMVYVRGTVSHKDHATIDLEGWHRVAMNTENQSRAMRSVAFLD